MALARHPRDFLRWIAFANLDIGSDLTARRFQQLPGELRAIDGNHSSFSSDPSDRCSRNSRMAKIEHQNPPAQHLRKEMNISQTIEIQRVSDRAIKWHL